MPDELTLLERLVAIPSVSGEEGPLALFVEQTAREWGLDAVRDETSVRVEVRGRAPGPTLALVSHLDVVPPGAGWTRDPFTPVVEDARLYGRGSGDAKASVAAMLCAAVDLHRIGLPAGRVVVILGYGEETRNTTMEQAVAVAGEIHGAVVGEPTNLEPATAQRGLMHLMMPCARVDPAAPFTAWERDRPPISCSTTKPAFSRASDPAAAAIIWSFAFLAAVPEFPGKYPLIRLFSELGSHTAGSVGRPPSDGPAILSGACCSPQAPSATAASNSGMTLRCAMAVLLRLGT